MGCIHFYLMMVKKHSTRWTLLLTRLYCIWAKFIRQQITQPLKLFANKLRDRAEGLCHALLQFKNVTILNIKQGKGAV